MSQPNKAVICIYNEAVICIGIKEVFGRFPRFIWGSSAAGGAAAAPGTVAGQFILRLRRNGRVVSPGRYA